jgi:hypothetical protein
MEIEYSGFYNKEIYFKTIYWIYKPSTRSLIIRTSIFIIFSILYILTIIAALQDAESSSFELARIVRHLITFLILGYIVFQPYISAYRKSSYLWKDPVIRGKIIGRISSIGIIIGAMEEPLTWDKFIKVNKTQESIALLTASRMFVLLQKDFFRDEQDWKMVNGIIDTKVQEVIE